MTETNKDRLYPILNLTLCIVFTILALYYINKINIVCNIVCEGWFTIVAWVIPAILLITTFLLLMGSLSLKNLNGVSK